MARRKKPSKLDHQKFLRELANMLLEGAESHARPAVQEVSRTLAQYLRRQIIDDSPGRVLGALSVPHYWAQYVHDGRGPATPQTASVLVWFRNPADDPRLAGGYPIKVKDIKKLTGNQLREWREKNRLAREQGLPEPMIVAKRSPRIGDYVKGDPFFSNDPARGGMRGFPQEAKRVAESRSRAYLQKVLAPYMDLDFVWRVRV